jgi:hypothetical protein
MDTAAELESGSGDDSRTAPAPAPVSPVTGLSLWPPPRSTRHASRRRRQLTVVAAVVVAAVVLAGGIAAALTLVGDGPQDDATPADQVDVDAFVGSWAGEMVQVDTEGEYVADWHAEVRIEEGAERGSTAWTTFTCSGTLEQSAAEGERLVFTYTETADPEDRCVDDAELTVTPDDGGLAAEWSSVTREGTRMVSTGRLE